MKHRSTYALLELAELHRNRGVPNGQQLLPAAWSDVSLTPGCRSVFSSQLYGHRWFIASIAINVGVIAGSLAPYCSS